MLGLEEFGSHRIVLSGRGLIQAEEIEAGGWQESSRHAFPSLIEAKAKADTAIAHETAIIVSSLVAVMCGSVTVEGVPAPPVVEKSARWGDTAVIVMRGGTFRVVMMVSCLPLGGDVEERRVVHVTSRRPEFRWGESGPRLKKNLGGSAGLSSVEAVKACCVVCLELIIRLLPGSEGVKAR